MSPVASVSHCVGTTNSPAWFGSSLSLSGLLWDKLGLLFEDKVIFLSFLSFLSFFLLELSRARTRPGTHPMERGSNIVVSGVNWVAFGPNAFTPRTPFGNVCGTMPQSRCASRPWVLHHLRSTERSSLEEYVFNAFNGDSQDIGSSRIYYLRCHAGATFGLPSNQKIDR